MIQNILQSLAGIQSYGIISLCLFFGVFTAAMVWTFTLQKSHLEAMAKLPLEDNHQRNNRKDHR